VYFLSKVLLGEIDEEKEANTSLKEVSLEEILEAQSKQQAEKEEQVSVLWNLLSLTLRPEKIVFVPSKYFQVKCLGGRRLSEPYDAQLWCGSQPYLRIFN